MKTNNQQAILRERISILEKQQALELQILKDQYGITIASFSTLSLLKSTIQEVIATPHLTSNVLHGALDMGTQYLTKTFLKSTPNKVTGWLGKIIRLVMKK